MYDIYMIQKLLKLISSPLGKIVLSCVWGFALAMIFQKTCADGRCIVLTGPPMEEVTRKIYDFDGDAGCYAFQAYPVACDRK